jgi:hypothetical protein
LRLLSKVLILFALLSALVSSVFADTTSGSSELLPKTLGKFTKSAKQIPPSTLFDEAPLDASDTHVPITTEIAEYVGKDGGRALVQILSYRQDGEAYEVFSAFSHNVLRGEIGTNVGTASITTHDETAFFKGVNFVRITNFRGSPAAELAQELSGVLDKGDGDIPSLIKHLPNFDEARKNAVYLNSFTDIHRLYLAPALSAIQSDGNADAVLASYGPARLLIVEFNTPQLAADNDQRIIARIQELWKLGQPAPSAYRRVGNYSVFVFDAPDEATAKQLIDQVKYEQVVQWLGENPNVYKEAQKRYINTTLGVLVAVLKASGYAALACLGLGGLFGGLLFSYRRSQQKEVTAYSDAGGMLRLNLDELTPETDPTRLLRERN